VPPSSPVPPKPPTLKASTPAIAPGSNPVTNPDTIKPDAISNGEITNAIISKRDRDLKNEITQKLQDNFLNNQLNVEVNKTNVVISGSVLTQEQLQGIKPLLLSVREIGTIEITAIVRTPANSAN
jgi:hypothetical protein